MRPLFVQAVADTPWLIVVTEGAGHFYYDPETCRLVWQLSDTGLDSLEGRVDFDALAVLFAKANGLFGEKEEAQVQKQGDVEQTVVSPLVQRKVDAVMDVIVEQTEALQESAEPEHGPEIIQDTGLNLGYLSDSGEDSEEETGTGVSEDTDMALGGPIQDPLEQGDDALDTDLNAGLDLDESPGDTGQTQARAEFVDLLDLFSGRINKYDPWFLVEEYLAAEFAQHAEYFALTSAEKEQVFDEWAQQQSTDRLAGQFPTPTLELLRSLQAHKKDIKKMYYGEFARAHPDVADVSAVHPELAAETVYRQFRVTLLDASEQERQAKLGPARPDNFKVGHVQAFVDRQLPPVLGAEGARLEALLQSGDGPQTAFDKWMTLCNELAVPTRVAEHPTNFILADEKRLGCYLSAVRRSEKRKQRFASGP